MRAALATGDDLPDMRRFGDPCLSMKDGKRWWGEATTAELRKHKVCGDLGSGRLKDRGPGRT